MRALFALFIRSVREDTRARVPTILRATLVLIILLIIWANQKDFTNHAAPGREFLSITLFANLGFLAIATLGSFASAITEEKEDQTLTLLRMTNLSALAILFGKGTSRLVGALLLLAVQIPFTLLAVTLGGVSLAQVLNAYAILGATTFFLCNLALLCSVFSRTTIRSGVWTGVIGVVLYAVLPFVFEETVLHGMSFPSPTPQTLLEYLGVWVVEANPVYALIILIEERSLGRLIVHHVVINLVAGTVCFLLSWLLFDRFCATSDEPMKRRKRRAATDPSANGLARRRPSIHRALAWKDFHFLIGGWRALFFRTVGCGLLFLGAYSSVRWVDGFGPTYSYFWRNVSVLTVIFATSAFALELALLASRIFGDERRSLTLGGLVGIPRTTGWLIRQKILGCIPILIPSICLFGIGCWIQIEYLWKNLPYWSLSFSESDVIVLSYIFTQALLLPIMVAALSLRIRRGAMPAGIAILTVWNVLTIVLVVVGGGANELAAFFFMAAVGFVIAIFLAIRVYHQIPRAAAAD